MEARHLALTDGGRYLVIPGFYSPDEAGEMLGRARELLDAFDPTGHPMVSDHTQG